MYRIATLAVLAAALNGGSPDRAAAEGVDDIRYDFFKDEDGRYRFDRIKGTIEMLKKSPEGFMWIEIPTIKSNKAPTNSASTVKKNGDGMAHLDEEVKRKQNDAPIVLTDDKDNEIPDVVTDLDRKNAAADITSYVAQLSLAHTVISDNRITGNIMIRNKGERKLKTLEVTLVVPVNTGKTEEHRFLFVDKPNSVAKPPQPGAASPALLQSIDLPAPAGAVAGATELKITYLKFADK